ncbi:MAG: LPXTG cell wall anchor domain-containing protein [Eubacteriales bacterium]|nr:LPXTG cell wall anchor domain-containing protein [Eubacteriales bacterium]
MRFMTLGQESDIGLFLAIGAAVVALVLVFVFRGRKKDGDE